MRSLISTLLIIAIGIYLVMMIFAWLFAEQMIFQPPLPSYGDSPQIITLNTENGEKIAATYLKNDDTDYTLLVSHGNAVDLGLLYPLLEHIREMGFSVFAYDYRGYGMSEGNPSEKHTYRDIDTAYKYLRNEMQIPANRIIALGQSLGGAVAADLASREPLGGLILESTFVTAYRVMTNIPMLPFDQFKTIHKIEKVDCPVLVIHGKQDRTIPLWHGKELYKKADEPKQHLWVEGAGHNNLVQVAGDNYRQRLHNFIKLVSDQ